jgi:hypothetical protein
MATKSARRRRRRRRRLDQEQSSLSPKEKANVNPFMAPLHFMNAFFSGDGETPPPRRRRTRPSHSHPEVEQDTSPAETHESKQPKTRRKVTGIRQVCAGCGRFRREELSKPMSEEELVEWGTFWGPGCIQKIEWVEGVRTIALCRVCQTKMRRTVKVNGRYTRTSFFAELGQRKDV